MRLRCGGIFSYLFTANLSPSLTAKEFWKSVKIWHEFGGLLFLEYSVLHITNSQLTHKTS